MQSTCTVGGATGGYCAIGSVNRAIAPSSTISSYRTDAKIGRRIKKWENFTGDGGWELVLRTLNLHLRAWKEVGEGEPVTLAWFMEDYLGHLEHHLAQAGG